MIDKSSSSRKTTRRKKKPKMGRDRNNNNNSGRGRRGRLNRRGRSRSKPHSGKKATEESTKKTLADHVYYVGSAKNASEYVTNTNFILNHIIELNLEEGLDIATALRDGKEFDFSTLGPKLQLSDKDPVQ